MAAWAAAALIAFRAVVISSFDLVFGGRGDGRLIVYLHEHLFKALQGRADFLSPPIFYPQRHGLGFTDAFVLDVLPYAAFRAIGLDPFLSVQTWAIVLSLFCFLASLIIGTRYLRLRLTFAIAASVLVTFPNNLLFKTATAHINFFALYYVPCILLLALWGVEDFPRVSRWSPMRVGLAAALFALLFSTGYYTVRVHSGNRAMRCRCLAPPASDRCGKDVLPATRFADCHRDLWLRRRSYTLRFHLRSGACRLSRSDFCRVSVLLAVPQ